MLDDGSILVIGSAGQLRSVRRAVNGLLLDRGFRVCAMVRRDYERTERPYEPQAPSGGRRPRRTEAMFIVVSGCRRVYFSMSLSAGYAKSWNGGDLEALNPTLSHGNLNTDAFGG